MDTLKNDDLEKDAIERGITIDYKSNIISIGGRVNYHKTEDPTMVKLYTKQLNMVI